VRKEVKIVTSTDAQDEGHAHLRTFLFQFGRLKCLQGTQIAENVDLTLKKY
jgi:hypothetical protein